MSERLAIAQVTPFAWEARSEVNEYVAQVSDELASRGHRVLIIAPSESSALVRDSRRALRNGSGSLLERADGKPLVLGVGEVLPFSPTRRRAPSLPLDVARTIEEALSSLALDVVHVHEPFAPSAASVALRHSRALNVGSFHAPTEPLLSIQLTRPLSRLLFGRLDARITSYRATKELLQSYFPGEYEVILPGASVEPVDDGDQRLELLLVGSEERAALRDFLRALRALPAGLEWRAAVWSSRALTTSATLSRHLRERVQFIDEQAMSDAQAIARAEVVVLASEGVRPAPGTLVRALASGAVPVATRLPLYEELLSEGEHGLEFEPGDVQTLAAQLERLISEPQLRKRSRAQSDRLRKTFAWTRVGDELEQLYAQLIARRHDIEAGERAQARLASRRLIDVDLHMHTDHSYDCATPVEVLLAEARSRGLGAIAITEFNDEAARFAAKYRIPAGAGSDAHVPQGLGSVRIRMRDFDGPEEFLESLRDADIVRNPASLLYVQALKFLQTKALPKPARKVARDRKVRRATGRRGPRISASQRRKS